MKKVGRPKIDWSTLTYDEYPLENILGRKSQHKKYIRGRESKIEDIDKEISELKKSIEKLEKSKIPHFRKIGDWEREIRLMNISIVEKTKLERGNESITILKDDKITRGKVSLYGKHRWVHIGSNHKHGVVNPNKLIGKMTNDELCEEFRYKLKEQIKSGKVKLLNPKQLEKRRGSVYRDKTGKVRKITTKRLEEIKNRKPSKFGYQPPKKK